MTMVKVRVIADHKPALDRRRFQVVDTDADVILAASDKPIGDQDASRIRDFVRNGGGLVALGPTLAAWSPSEPIRQLAGWIPGDPGPETELIVRPNGGHPVTERIEDEWKIRGRLYASEGPPGEATVLLRTSWRYTEQVVGYERKVGGGTFVYLGLSDDGSATFASLVARSLLHAAGVAATPAVGVGLLGYGAIGREHAASIVSISGLRLAAVCDLSPERRESASRDWSVRTYAEQDAMLDDPEVGLVVVGTPPSAHTNPVLSALRAGKHVVCEKPFAISLAEVDHMMDAAESHGRVLTVFQSRRWDPDYIVVRDAVRSGRIGEPFYMESFIGGFEHPCDFWHSHEPISGGTIYDWGSHYFDWILQLFDDRVRSVTAQAHKRVWHDVTNDDQVRVDLTFAGGAQASFLQSAIAMARKPKWYLLGTEGAIVADWVAAPVPADLPARVTVSTQRGDEVLRLPARDDNGFYRNLADHLAWGDPLAVTSEEARRNVAVMEAATRSIKSGGVPVQVDT